MGDTTTEVSEAEIKKPVVKEVPMVQDEGFFQHDTGDTYDGSFEAKKKDRSVKMHGPGVYKTAEGDVYTGMWDNDRLGANEEVSIAFTDNSKYMGFFKDWCFSGQGKYVYPDSSVLACEFVENSPVGNMVLTDPNDHIWLGRADQGYGWFEPVNHFYTMLEKTRESSKIRRRQQSKQDNTIHKVTADERDVKSTVSVKPSGK